jgi:hypothetical protein
MEGQRPQRKGIALHLTTWSGGPISQLSAERKAFVFSTRKGNLEGMKEAVEAGASLDTPIDTEGATAYHWTASEGNFEIMEWLASKGAGHSARDKAGITPMHYAVCDGHVVALEWLAAHGADIAAVNVSGIIAMHTAVQAGQVAPEANRWLFSTPCAFTNFPYKPTLDTLPFVARLLERRMKLDKKALSTEHCPIGACSCGHRRIRLCWSIQEGRHVRRGQGDIRRWGRSSFLVRQGAAWRLVEAWPR